MKGSKKYQCKKCNWSGSGDQLEKDTVETCFGNDVVNACPACGTFEVAEIKEKTKDTTS